MSGAVPEPSAAPGIAVALAGGDSPLRKALTRSLVADSLDVVEERDSDVLVWIGSLVDHGQRPSLRDALDTDQHVIAVVPAVEAIALRRAIARGLRACLIAAQASAALAPAVRSVVAGQCVVPTELFEAPGPVLSSREKQVLGMVVLGMTNAQMAEKLFLAESTVKSHLSSSFAKLGVRNRRQAVVKILDPESHLGLGILAITPTRSTS